jgi:hypothetical protein
MRKGDSGRVINSVSFFAL